LIEFGSNLISSFADSGPMERGVAAMDLVVWHDLFMAEEAERFADVVLPGTAWLEEYGCKATNTHLYLTDRILDPPGETRSLARVTRDLAERLGIDGFYPWPGETGHIDAVLDHPATGHATVASLRAAGGIAALNISPVAHPELRFDTPSGKIEFYSDQASKVGLSPLPSYTPREADGFPLELRMGRTLEHFHAFYDHGRALPSLAKLEPGPQLWISPADASLRGIATGEMVRMVNRRGEFVAIARVTDQIPSGTLWIHDGWPGLNRLSSGVPTLTGSVTDLVPFSIGQAAYETRVEVQRVGSRVEATRA
jgi:anaerobic selenocysteine-containing dehydrogenase